MTWRTNISPEAHRYSITTIWIPLPGSMGVLVLVLASLLGLLLQSVINKKEFTNVFCLL